MLWPGVGGKNVQLVEKVGPKYVGKPLPNLYLKRIEEMFTPRSDGLEHAQEQTERRIKGGVSPVC